MATVMFSGCKPAAPPVADDQVSDNTTLTAETPVSETPADEPDALKASSEDDKVADVLAAGGDWPQWGGTRLRNNVPSVTNLPSTWNVGGYDVELGAWSDKNAENIAWYAELGSQTYGNPVVADGKVFVGTNNGAGHLKRYPATVDLGCLLAFSEEDGSFLWQHSSEKQI